MRLTLRTLLAYMDDILEPAQAKEIGIKIAESDFASSLSNRIREVMRQRRLTAPDLEGPSSGIDPNTIAEYLDNTLSPELVADLEKICLESNVHLAEVAACHQILTLVLGEPVTIDPQSRERMYALAPPMEKPQSEASLEPQTTQPTTADSTSAASTPAGSAQRKPSFNETIPAYLRRPPLWKRMLPYATVLVLLGAFLALIVTDDSLFPDFFGVRTVEETAPETASKSLPGEQIAAKTGSSKTTIASQSPTKTSNPDSRTKKKSPNTIASQKKTSPTPKTTVPPTTGIDPPPPPDKGENTAKSPSGKTPAGTGSKVVGTTPPIPVPKTKTVPSTPSKVVPDKKVIPTNPAKKAITSAPLPLKYITPAGQGLLFRRSLKQNTWLAVPSKSTFSTHDRLVAAPPFDASFDLNNGENHLDLISGSSMELLAPSEAGKFGVELRHGRMVVRAGKKPDQKDLNSTTTFGLKIRDRLWRVVLSTPGTICGIEVKRLMPNSFEEDLGPNNYSANLYVLSGSVQLFQQNGASVEIRGDDSRCGRLSFPMPIQPVSPMKNPERPVSSNSFGAISSAEIPLWLTPAGRKPSESVIRAARSYLNEFQLEPPAKDMGVAKMFMEENLTAIVRDRRPKVAEFASQALAAAESYSGMVKTLVRTKHEEVRQAAIDGLRKWLPTNPDNRKLLKAELGKVFAPKESAAVYRLLWGFNEQDARDGETSRQLIEWMEHDQDTIRQLAFSHVYRLTKIRHSYGPFISPVYRARSIARWQTHLNKYGALLPPEMKKQ